MKFDWFDISDQKRSDWENLCEPNHYRIIEPGELPDILPKLLTNKFDSILIMASGTTTGTAYYIANGNRVDYKANAIDQQPFGLAFVGNNPIGSGCLIQHGTWQDRTTNPPDDFWEKIEESGIGNCFPLPELPESPYGKIEALKKPSYKDAFSAVIKQLKKQ
ncbi:hypothetical protein KJ855_00005 [Patescibacteria group bacterium]|nr:hypothetical protein [Patescibacteria group bacterium]